MPSIQGTLNRRVWLAVLLVILASTTVLVVILLSQPSPEQPNPAVPSFAIQANPVSVQQGDIVYANVTVASQNNFDSAVTLAVTNVPTGITGSWTQSIVTPPRNGTFASRLVLDVTVNVPAQVYNLTINAKGEGILKTALLSLTVLPLPPVPTFGLTVTPLSMVIDQGQSGHANVTISSQNGFSSAVTLTTTRYPGVNASFSNGMNSIIVTPAPDADVTRRLDIVISSNATTRFYSLNVTAANGSLTKTRIILVNVPPPPVVLYLQGWTEGWNHTDTNPSTIEPCSPSGTPTCNPSLSVVQGQKLVVAFESFDGAHDIAYYPGGYPSSNVPLPAPSQNPDALNRSDTITVGQLPVTLTYRFDSPGTYEYYCEYHVASQHGNVTVVPNASLALTSGEDNVRRDAPAMFVPQQPNWLPASYSGDYRVKTPRELS